ncbi:MAG TPA: hypothetical protein VGI86_13005 [Acidimicrobiia bacterium]
MIGSGVVGACVGWHLTQREVEVVMIDAAPVIRRLLTHEILDGTVDELAEPYRPDRFTDRSS